MRKDILALKALCALIFGLKVFLNPVFGERMVFFPRTIGIACIALGTITFLVLFVFQNNLSMRLLLYVHASFLMILAGIGIIRDLQGVDNILWIFAINLYCIDLISMYRGEHDE